MTLLRLEENSIIVSLLPATLLDLEKKISSLGIRPYLQGHLTATASPFFIFEIQTEACEFSSLSEQQFSE